MNELPLGKHTVYNEPYNPELLFPIERKTRETLRSLSPDQMKGYDLWNAYEFSYLNLDGKPVNAIFRMAYPSDSCWMIESKSLKLYLGSLSMMKFENSGAVLETVKKDLEKKLASPLIYAELLLSEKQIRFQYWNSRILVDSLEVSGFVYQPDPGLLKVSRNRSYKKAELGSHLLKTNCPVTGQPDWGSVYVNYQSKNILNRESFLKYIVSYREHQDFHETTCEKIFNDLYGVLQPDFLVVKCFYTRRGGIDINPCRFYGIRPDNDFIVHLWRQ